MQSIAIHDARGRLRLLGAVSNLGQLTSNPTTPLVTLGQYEKCRRAAMLEDASVTLFVGDAADLGRFLPVVKRWLQANLLGLSASCADAALAPACQLALRVDAGISAYVVDGQPAKSRSAAQAVRTKLSGTEHAMRGSGFKRPMHRMWRLAPSRWRTPMPLVLMLALGSSATAAAPSLVSANGPESRQSDAGVEWFAALRVDGAPQIEKTGGPDWLVKPWGQDAGAPTSFYVHRLGGGIEPLVEDEATVNSCDGLFKAELRDLLPPTTKERAAYSKRRMECYAGRAVSQTVAAKESFVKDFKMDEAHLRRLPSELATIMSPGSQDEEVGRIIEQGGFLGDVIDYVMPSASFNAANVEDLKRIVVTFDEDWTQEWTWLARGDFNRDGVEDLLISSRLYSDGLDDYGLFIVTRLAADAPMTSVQEIPLYPGDEKDLCGEFTKHCAREILLAD